MVFYSDSKHLHQRLQPAIHQFSKLERYMINNCVNFREAVKDGNSVILLNILSVIEPCHSLNWLNDCCRGK